MEELVTLLKEKKLTIGSCESLTAGLFASNLAEVPGASSVLKGGIITYQSVCKETIVHVPHDLIVQYGVISAPCAEAMAKGARALIDCDICVSFTGNAGPAVMEGKPAGMVFCGLAMHDTAISFECQFRGTRNEVREQSVAYMCEKVKEILHEREGNTWKNKK